MRDQDQVFTPIAVDVADYLVTRLDQVADTVEDFPLEQLEGNRVKEVFFSCVAGDFQHLFGNVGEYDIGNTIAIQITCREVRKNGRCALTCSWQSS